MLTILSTAALAQLSEDRLERNNSGKSYLFPMKPGTPASLAGTMGELRSTHFHSGIDIRTYNEIGWPVLAANDGYISRAVIEGSGFGNYLYVKHPDGNTTLYGHLNGFNDKVAKYVLTEQYRRKEFSVNLYFREGQFAVKRGDTIAFSGNSGSSQGPHLHFDIRDSKMDPLDPLDFGFDEVKDVAPPIAQKIALTTMDENSRINDQFGRFEYYLLRSGTDYKLSYPIMASGRIGVELLGYDRMDSWRYKMGINYIDLYADDKLVFKQEIKKVDLSEGRSIYALMDYKTMNQRGSRYYRLYIEDGNTQQFYTNSPGRGIIEVDPANGNDVRIVMKDIYGNSSEVKFQLKAVPVTNSVRTLEAVSKASMDIQRNTLTITARPCDENAILFQGSDSKTMQPAYSNSVQAVYLVDLRKDLPDSIVLCDETLVTDFQTMIPSGRAYRYYSDWAEIYFPNQALLDSNYFQAKHHIDPDGTEVFSIGDPMTPLKRNISVSLKPNGDYPNSYQVAIYRKVGRAYYYGGGKWQNGRFDFITRNFGDYQILIDTIPPTITRVYANSTVARFKIRDNLSGVNSWEATINGEWLLMEYDSKTATLRSEKLNKSKPLQGEFKLVVTDKCGNKQEYKQTIY